MGITMRKLGLFVAVLGFSQFANADCDFTIANLTNFEFTAQVGFYNGSESTITVQPSITTIYRVKSTYACNATTVIGTGRAYIVFPKDPDGAGANYLPSQNGINLMGSYAGSSGGRYIRANNGQIVLMDANGGAVTDTSFTVRLNFVSRPNSRSAGTT